MRKLKAIWHILFCDAFTLIAEHPDYYHYAHYKMSVMHCLRVVKQKKKVDKKAMIQEMAEKQIENQIKEILK
ncbi:MAG: hypothetical protein V4714_17810 [Bacteroidota bacterium]